jgi:hypothetical protein
LLSIQNKLIENQIAQQAIPIGQKPGTLPSKSEPNPKAQVSVISICGEYEEEIMNLKVLRHEQTSTTERHTSRKKQDKDAPKVSTEVPLSLLRYVPFPSRLIRVNNDHQIDKPLKILTNKNKGDEQVNFSVEKQVPQSFNENSFCRNEDLNKLVNDGLLKEATDDSLECKLENFNSTSKVEQNTTFLQVVKISHKLQVIPEVADFEPTQNGVMVVSRKGSPTSHNLPPNDAKEDGANKVLSFLASRKGSPASRKNHANHVDHAWSIPYEKHWENHDTLTGHKVKVKLSGILSQQ